MRERERESLIVQKTVSLWLMFISTLNGQFSDNTKVVSLGFIIVHVYTIVGHQLENNDNPMTRAHYITTYRVSVLKFCLLNH